MLCGYLCLSRTCDANLMYFQETLTFQSKVLNFFFKCFRTFRYGYLYFPQTWHLLSIAVKAFEKDEIANVGGFQVKSSDFIQIECLN